MRLSLGRGRFADINEENVVMADRFATATAPQGLGIAFINDAGEAPIHVGTILVPKDRIGALVASLVGAASRLGVDWTQVVEDPVVIEGDWVH